MKLYLSSMGLGERPERLAALGGRNRAVAVIMNAQDAVKDAGSRERRLQEECTGLRAIGLEPEQLDLREYFGREADLAACIEQIGYVWAAGGNTFVLRRAFAASGLDRLLEARRTRSDIVYAGYSAGACVVTPTLRGVEFADDPDELPDGYSGPTIWDGLDFVPFAIIPHFKGYGHSDLDRRTIDTYVERKLPFVALRDSEALAMEATERASLSRLWP